MTLKKYVSFLLVILTSLMACEDGRYDTQDLDAMYRAIVENHPGVHNMLDPGFVRNMEKNYMAARARVLNARDVSTYKDGLQAFAKGFEDTHVYLNWHQAAVEHSEPRVVEKFSVKHLNADTCLIRLPTFELTSEQEKELKEVKQQLPAFRSKKLIVFDLRGNSGGNSYYGSQVIEALFGRAYAAARRNQASKGVYIDWRVSEGNIAHIQMLHDKYPEVTFLGDVLKGLRQARNKGLVYYREDIPFTELPVPPSLVPAKIAVIIDRHNCSAALDFIDELKLMHPDTLLIGEQTKADRLYMEVRSIELPSGLGTFTFPIKVYRKRMRGDNVPYTPDVVVDVKDVGKIVEMVKRR